MSESKWKKQNPGKAPNKAAAGKTDWARYIGVADHLVAGKTGFKPRGKGEFINAMLGHAGRNSLKLDILDAAGQADYLRDLFDASHIIIGIWPDARKPEGFDFRPIKGDDSAKLAAAFPNGGAVMVSAVGVETRTEADDLADGYAGLYKKDADGQAQSRWEFAMPANRELFNSTAAMAAILDWYERT
ncbi:hypothetical protein MKK58_01130 [Methylobacterium sp. J-078]|jgi:hypothetical protein|uniref:hypothetical protein n=1 Tax=Methylobacterium sp. J-078 TaxID=2836657 RepID=UPI001FBA63BF|nr:hypothetical protein [Methylobacterium sp. J-078]MCJ2043158.1 hypothetical protein [Methylobacterium sp. J-078]